MRWLVALLVLSGGAVFGQGQIPGADVTIVATIPFPPGGGTPGSTGGRGGTAGTDSWPLVQMQIYCRGISDPANVGAGGLSAASLVYTFYGKQTTGGGTNVGTVNMVENFGGGLTRAQVWSEIDSGYSSSVSMKWNWAFDDSGNNDTTGRNTYPLWNAFKTAITTGDTSVLCDWATINTHDEDASNAAYWEQDPASYTPCAQCQAGVAQGGGGGPTSSGGGGVVVGSLCGGPDQPPCPGPCDYPGKPCCDQDKDGCCDVDDPEPSDATISCEGCVANWKATWDNIIGTVRSWGVDLSGLTCSDCVDIQIAIPLPFPNGDGTSYNRSFAVGVMPDQTFVAYAAVDALRQVCRAVSALAFLCMFLKHLWILVRQTI